MTISVTAFALVAFVSYSQAASADEWTYRDQDRWPGVCNSGARQSPVDIDTSKTTDLDLPEYDFTGYTNIAGTLVNTGHSVAFRIKNETRPEIQGGGLKSNYKFHEFHFHWPSEHTVDGESYPLEMHLVHFEGKYGSLSEALDGDDSLAVFGVFFNISSTDNEDLSDFISLVPQIEEADAVVQVPDLLNVRTLFPGDTTKFFRYKGSLTTPNCQEVVVWTVFKETLTISQKQFDQLTHIKDHDGNILTRNARDVQDLGERTINCNGQ